ncbi:hypothetical protein [Megasphaera sp.]|uniref:hypothetical protein n=1 Tax=Megasphaera sp. TaxID=2023260 RepID=UPI00351F86B7
MAKTKTKTRPKLKVYEDCTGVVWVRSPELQKRFSLCRTTVYTLLSEMRKMPKYCQSFLDLSHTLRLVKLADFERFLRERSEKKAWLR